MAKVCKRYLFFICIKIAYITGMHFPSMISLISQRLHETERASFFSLLTSGSALGTLLTGSLGSYLLENYNWVVVFQTLGI